MAQKNLPCYIKSIIYYSIRTISCFNDVKCEGSVNNEKNMDFEVKYTQFQILAPSFLAL